MPDTKPRDRRVIGRLVSRDHPVGDILHTLALDPARAGTVALLSSLQLTADPTGQIAYDKKHAAVKAGKLAIRFVNKSTVPHNVTIAKGARVLASTKTIQGATTTATANLPPGGYVFFCSVDAHRQAGVQGTLTVR